MKKPPRTESPYMLGLVEREEVTLDIYFLNNTDLPIENLRMVSAGTVIWDDTVFPTDTHEEVVGDVPARGAVLAGKTDVYELDDTFLGFTARFTTGGEEKSVDLGIPSYALIYSHAVKELPILGGPGFLMVER